MAFPARLKRLPPLVLAVAALLAAHSTAKAQHSPAPVQPVAPAAQAAPAAAPPPTAAAQSPHIPAAAVSQSRAAAPATTPTASASTVVEVGNTTGVLEPDAEAGKTSVRTRAVAAAPVAAKPLAPIDPKSLDPVPLQSLTKSVAGLELEAGKARGDLGLGRVRDEAAAVETSAASLATTRAKTLAVVDQQLKTLSTKSGSARPRLSEAETRQRKALVAERAELAGQVKAAQAAVATAGETYNAVASKRRNDFTARIFERTASPLEVGFWGSLADSVEPDGRRLGALAGDAADAALGASEPRGLISALAALILAVAIAFPLRLRLKAISRRRAAAAISAGGLRRSAHALGSVLIDTLLPGLAALVLDLGLTWGEVLSRQAAAMAGALVVVAFWCAAILALGRQLAAARDPDERLLPVPDPLAARMRVLSWAVALTTGAGFLLYRLNVVAGASVASTIAANCVTSLAYVSVAGLILAALGSEHEEGAEEEVRAPARMGLSLALSAAMVVTVVAVFAGFTTFAALVARQIYWISVLAGIAYLLIRFAGDLVDQLFRPQGVVGRVLLSVFNLRHATGAQLGVVTSAVLQSLIAFAAVMLAIHPFGGGGDLFSAHAWQVGGAMRLGSIEISPRSVGAGLLSLVLGLFAVHLVERWVDRRFLPVTDWDSGVRNSVATGVRYLGVGGAILWALAAAGLGFKQIALVASALSVGIGFGLQQIVQNFVSGLILLVERPVKVGDWINLGGVEGDVKSIRVRATEIETFDRTTVIVPNSDLITKQVQNKTLGDPRGRVSLRFSVGAAADAPRAMDAALAVFAADAEVLRDPTPKVFIDSLTEGGSVNFVTYAYVASQRDVLRLRSRLYAALIAAFAAEKIGFVGGPATNIVEPGPDLRGFIADILEQQASRAHQTSAQPHPNGAPTGA